jgi:hypothetical protein
LRCLSIAACYRFPLMEEEVAVEEVEQKMNHYPENVNYYFP